MTCKSPVVMIGVDAATWDVINPLLDKGKLPNLKQLMEHGVYGTLKSDIRYTSPALWTSISTGKRPEKHGVLDFYSATRLHNRCATLFDIIDNNEGKIGLFRWFATWPPLKNAGFTVPSPIARTPETFPKDLIFINEITYPKNLWSYINGGIQFIKHGGKLSTILLATQELFYELLQRPDHLDWWYRRRLVEVAIHSDMFVYLFNKYQPNVAAILFTLIDDLGHRYWKFFEPELFEDVNKDEVEKFNDVINKAYIAVDEVIGKMLKILPEETLVVVLSDHGQKAGPSLEYPFILSKNLIKLIGYSDKVWMTNIAFKSFIRLHNSDSNHTSISELKSLLSNVKLSKNGLNVLEINDESEARLTVQISLDKHSDLNSKVLLPGGRVCILNDIVSHYDQISGHHSEDGILIIKGERLKKNFKFEEACIFDVTPSILALCDLAIADDMDGQVIKNIITNNFLMNHPIKFIPSYDNNNENIYESLSPEQLEKLESRLRDLGYLA